MAEDVNNYTVQEYIELAKHAAKLANDCWSVSHYAPEDIEVLTTLVDHGDGKGLVFKSVAAVRNPVDNNYDILHDVVGGTLEALESLIEVLERMKSEKIVDLIAAVKSKDSNSKLN